MTDIEKALSDVIALFAVQELEQPDVISRDNMAEYIEQLKRQKKAVEERMSVVYDLMTQPMDKYRRIARAHGEDAAEERYLNDFHEFIGDLLTPSEKKLFEKVSYGIVSVRCHIEILEAVYHDLCKKGEI